MAKRKRKNSLIESISAQATQQATAEDTSKTAELSAISSMSELPEAKTQYECLTNAIEQLSDLNVELPDDIKTFGDFASPEINEAIAGNEKTANAEAELSDLSAANLKLQSENASLQEENDKYLMKISELTFENAKLNAQLQELSKHSNCGTSAPFNESTIQNKFGISESSKNVNYPCQPTNSGYTSWN